MKKAFTLVELMVVVVVLVTLMSIMFRLAAIGGDSEARNATADRMHRMENALSGYFAAFGTYPPVKIHGSQNPFLTVSDHGLQNEDGEENTAIWNWLNSDGTGVANNDDEQKAWAQVEAACKAQPVCCMFPYPKEYSILVEKASETMKEYATSEDSKMSETKKRIFSAGFDDGVSSGISRFSPYRNEYEWNRLQLFKFGLMSFLLPRYLIMMNGDSTFFKNYAQWLGNNTLPADPFSADGDTFGSWEQMQQNYVQSKNKSDIARIANIPSQASCARWMANFDHALCCNHDFVLFGVNVKGTGIGQQFGSLHPTPDGESIEVYTPGGYDQDSAGGNQYVLDQITMKDGWGEEFYYYSPAPYQSYVLWSGGKNKRTFPPWIDRSKLGGQANSCIGYWTQDDIVNLSK